MDARNKDNAFMLFEGPPSISKNPGIHNVLARSIKDTICRYQTLKGRYVFRKAGWDTHDQVERALHDISQRVLTDDPYINQRMNTWAEFTKKMGYWIDLTDPYQTSKNYYIENLWSLLKCLYNKGLLYKRNTIQPYSPTTGNSLCSHELNGYYHEVEDLTCVALFKLKKDARLDCFVPRNDAKRDDIMTYAIAWTTTPWTLPSNTALCVGPNIDYVLLKTVYPYTEEPCYILMAKALVETMFKEAPEVVKEYKGKDLVGIEYEQLIPWVNPGEGAFRIIPGDYVTTEDGTGIVPIAPTFGADDKRVAADAGIPPLQMIDKDGKAQPMVDRTGKFWLIKDLDSEFVKNCMDVEAYRPYAGQFVKDAYDPTKTEEDKSLDVDIVVMLKEEGKLFKCERYRHDYPHCWRTDKPVLYYPFDSWFIKTTALKDRMIELNKTINWKPVATGSNLFVNQLKNFVDWNISRIGNWGTPLSIWRTEDGKEAICIGSVKELRDEIEKSIKAGFMTKNPYTSNDYRLHRPYIDEVVLVSNNGKKMFREPDLVDDWFDCGAMPYAQYPHLGEEDSLDKNMFTADFIAEGVNQIYGWFFTLHVIAVMCFERVAFKNVISTGMVLDKYGKKMSTSLNNNVEPFEVIETYGADAVRWYMITKSQPGQDLRFDKAGIDEVRRKFFGTLYNTYDFFATFANNDNFNYAAADININERPEIDRWILSKLNSLILKVDKAYSSYDPTCAGCAIAEFVVILSNKYVRKSHCRFRRNNENKQDKLSAYQTLYTCLETVAILSSPIAPFFSEQLYLDLNNATHHNNAESVHLTDFPVADMTFIDKALENNPHIMNN